VDSLLDASEARKAVEIIEAIYESAERGEPVRLDYSRF
jgi:predicted dehydrogenase